MRKDIVNLPFDLHIAFGLAPCHADHRMLKSFPVRLAKQRYEQPSIERANLLAVVDER